jgi:hypothetical protein
MRRDGKEHVRQGKIAEACAAFEASEKADHSVATVLSLADCREKNRQYASAWALFLEADSQTRTDTSKAALNSTARARAAALEPRLSYLTINVPDESRVADLVVSRDGIAIDPAEWNRSIPIDGGPHEISGKAPGHESWSTKVVIAPERDKQSVEVPKFKELPKLGDAAPRTARGGDALARRGGDAGHTGGDPAILHLHPAPQARDRPGGRRRGARRRGHRLRDRRARLDNEALAKCPPPSCSAQAAAEARALNDRARGRALVANIGFAAGGAAVLASGVLWYLGGPRAEATVPPGDDDGTEAAPRRRPRRSVAISPQVGATSGIAVWRTF